MNEILFRGKRVDNGEWVEGCLLIVTLEGKTAHLIFGDNFCFVGNDVKALSHALVDPATVGQYTGLQDENGKRIFEGDIVDGLFLFGLSVKSTVGFRFGAFGLRWMRGNVEEFSPFTSICNVLYKVRGNIHDNPELLKEGA